MEYMSLGLSYHRPCCCFSLGFQLPVDLERPSCPLVRRMHQAVVL